LGQVLHLLKLVFSDYFRIYHPYNYEFQEDKGLDYFLDFLLMYFQLKAVDWHLPFLFLGVAYGFKIINIY